MDNVDEWPWDYFPDLWETDDQIRPSNEVNHLSTLSSLQEEPIENFLKISGELVPLLKDTILVLD